MGLPSDRVDGPFNQVEHALEGAVLVRGQVRVGGHVLLEALQLAHESAVALRARLGDLVRVRVRVIRVRLGLGQGQGQGRVSSEGEG